MLTVSPTPPPPKKKKEFEQFCARLVIFEKCGSYFTHMKSDTIRLLSHPVVYRCLRKSHILTNSVPDTNCRNLFGVGSIVRTLV